MSDFENFIAKDNTNLKSIDFETFLIENKLLIETSTNKTVPSLAYCLLQDLKLRDDDFYAILKEFYNHPAAKNLLELDYGGNADLITSNVAFGREDFLPVSYAVAAISNHFNRDVLLICDELNISFLHQGKFIVRIGSRELRGDPIVFALTEYNIFSPVIIHDMDSLLKLPCGEVFVSDFEFKSGTKQKKQISREIQEENAPFHSAMHAIIAEPGVDINNFVDANVLINENGYEIKASAYCSETRVDIVNSDYRLKSFLNVDFDRTIDIDGIFAVIKPSNLRKVIRSGGCIHACPFAINDENGCKKIQNYVEMIMETEFHNFEVADMGKLIDKNGIQMFICRGSNDSKPFRQNIATIAKSAHAEAIKFKCEKENNCGFALQHRSDKCGRPEDLDQLEAKMFHYEHGVESFGCVLSSISAYLEKFSSSNEQFFFYFRSIGSKFKSSSTDSRKLPLLIKDFLVPFNITELLPTASLDLCEKIIPTCKNTGTKVQSN